MRQQVAEETADQTTEQVISYDRIKRRVAEVEKKAGRKAARIEKRVQARIEDKGLVWLFNKITGRPTERVQSFEDVSDLRGRYKNIKEAHISFKGQGKAGDEKVEIGRVSLTDDKTHMRRVINLPDKTESSLKWLVDKLGQGLKSVFSRAVEKTKDIKNSLQRSWNDTMSRIDWDCVVTSARARIDSSLFAVRQSLRQPVMFQEAALLLPKLP